MLLAEGVTYRGSHPSLPSPRLYTGEWSFRYCFTIAPAPVGTWAFVKPLLGWLVIGRIPMEAIESGADSLELGRRSEGSLPQMYCTNDLVKTLLYQSTRDETVGVGVDVG
jgi:hypothetical protein